MKQFLTCLVLCTSVVLNVFAQQSPTENTVFDVDLRHIRLDEALAEFSAITGAGVTYDPRITRGHIVYCVIANAEINRVLSCLLDSSDLTFARLESGTFLVIPQGNAPLENGHLSGLVTDLSTGTPLVDAHVLLASNTLDVGAITNNNGQFHTPLSLTWQILCTNELPGIYQHGRYP